jgi:hypothetical protein
MRKNADIVFSAALAAVFAFIFFDGLTMDARTRAFPVAVSAPMMVLALFNLGRVVLESYRSKPEPAVATGELTGSQRMEALATVGRVEVDAKTTRKRIGNILLWMAGSFVLLWMLGFREGLPIFVFLFLWRESRDRLWFAATLGIATWLVLHLFFGYFLNYPWPTPQISLWFGFDWPGIS